MLSDPPGHLFACSANRGICLLSVHQNQQAPGMPLIEAMMMSSLNIRCPRCVWKSDPTATVKIGQQKERKAKNLLVNNDANYTHEKFHET